MSLLGPLPEAVPAKRLMRYGLKHVL